jgi:dihydrofolate reductase
MGKLIYSVSTSLDGFAADSDGNIDWGTPSEEEHAFIDDYLRNTGTFLLGRKMYETLAIWDKIPTEGTNEFMDGPSQAMNDFAKIWQAADKIVYSTTLTEVKTARTTIEREFDPETIQNRITKSEKDFGIGGAHLAAAAIKGGIVDEYHQIIIPILLGGGTHWLPRGVRIKLELVRTRTFDNGFVSLLYKQI